MELQIQLQVLLLLIRAVAAAGKQTNPHLVQEVQAAVAQVAL